MVHYQSENLQGQKKGDETAKKDHHFLAATAPEGSFFESLQYFVGLACW
jgi:hypothetical protein